jgi:hypothetical protein
MLFPLLAVLIHTLGGEPIQALETPAGSKAIVYIFTSTECPISNRYAPEIQRVVRTFAPQGIVFRLVYPRRGGAAAGRRAPLTPFF